MSSFSFGKAKLRLTFPFRRRRRRCRGRRQFQKCTRKPDLHYSFKRTRGDRGQHQREEEGPPQGLSQGQEALTSLYLRRRLREAASIIDNLIPTTLHAPFPPPIPYERRAGWTSAGRHRRAAAGSHFPTNPKGWRNVFPHFLLLSLFHIRGIEGFRDRENPLVDYEEGDGVARSRLALVAAAARGRRRKINVGLRKCELLCLWLLLAPLFRISRA